MSQSNGGMQTDRLKARNAQPDCGRVEIEKGVGLHSGSGPPYFSDQKTLPRSHLYFFFTLLMFSFVSFPVHQKGPTTLRPRAKRNGCVLSPKRARTRLAFSRNRDMQRRKLAPNGSETTFEEGGRGEGGFPAMPKVVRNKVR